MSHSGTFPPPGAPDSWRIKEAIEDVIFVPFSIGP